MKKIFLLTAAIAFLLSGCIEVNMKVSLRPDGSGTVQETVILSNTFVNAMREMTKNMGGEVSEIDNISKIDEKELREEAESMGEGVRFVKAEPIETAKGKGRIAYFEFDDVNKIHLNENPTSHMPEDAQMPGADNSDQSSDNVYFTFEKGDVSTLTIIRPEDKNAEESDSDEEYSEKNEENGELSDENLQYLEILKDMRISLKLDIEGDIVENNASFTDGNEITLLDMDMGALVKNKETLKKLMKEDPNSFDELTESINQVEGIKIENKDKIVIKFK